MIDAVVGAVIMVMATTSLLYSIELAERAFDQAGRYPLSTEEKEILGNVGIVGDEKIEEFWRDNINLVPREVGLDE